MSEVAIIRAAVSAALLQAGPGPIVIGCSYGPDSLVLADAALAVRPADIVLVYVDHGLRTAARAEGHAVIALAESTGARGRVVSVEVVRAGTGLEDAARAARHAALLAVADEIGARWVLLGHTASDQAETVIARLLRGAGPRGLAGMAAVRGRFVRPLLGIERSVVRAYAAARGLTPAEDPMNADPSFLRSRVRHRILPMLRAENPSIDETLRRTSRAMREVSEALDWAADRAIEEQGAGPRFVAAALAALPAAVGKLLLARAAAALGVALEARHLDAALAFAARPARGSATLRLPRLVLRRVYADLVLEPAAAGRAGCEVTIAASEADGPCVARLWLPGDRMRPAGLGGRSRKLQDLFTDRKIPAADRRKAVVVLRERDGTIVWAEHVGVAATARVEVSLTRSDPAVI